MNECGPIRMHECGTASLHDAAEMLDDLALKFAKLPDLIDNAGRNDPPVAVVVAHHGQLPNGTQTSGECRERSVLQA